MRGIYQIYRAKETARRAHIHFTVDGTRIPNGLSQCFTAHTHRGAHTLTHLTASMREILKKKKKNHCYSRTLHRTLILDYFAHIVRMFFFLPLSSSSVPLQLRGSVWQSCISMHSVEWVFVLSALTLPLCVYYYVYRIRTEPQGKSESNTNTMPMELLALPPFISDGSRPPPLSPLRLLRFHLLLLPFSFFSLYFSITSEDAIRIFFLLTRLVLILFARNQI